MLVHSILYRLAGNGTLSQTPLSETRKIITHENCDYRMCRNILDRIFMLVQDVLCVIYWWQIKNDNGNKMIPKHHTRSGNCFDMAYHAAITIIKVLTLLQVSWYFHKVLVIYCLTCKSFICWLPPWSSLDNWKKVVAKLGKSNDNKKCLMDSYLINTLLGYSVSC